MCAVDLNYKLILPFHHAFIPEPPESLLQSPSVAYMKGQDGVLLSLLARKRMVLGWTYYLYALCPTSKKIYQYRSELVSITWWPSV